MTGSENTLPDSQERIYKQAALLFAKKGYAGTSIRDISRSVGVSISTIQYHVGNKETLYLEILRRTHQMEYELLSPRLETVDESILTDLDSLSNLLKQFFVVFIKRSVDEPETYRLWTHFFLEDSDELVKLDDEFSLPFYQMALNLLRRSRKAGTISLEDENLKILVSSVAWLMHGYFNGCKNNWGDPNYDRYDSANVEGFRYYLDLYIDRMLRPSRV
jgi:AcrR family transcriptional regulator